MSGPVDIRAGRFAANEAAYRGVNERIRRYKEGDQREPMSFVCECAEGGCIDQIDVDLADYRRVRKDSRRFVISPGHDAPEMERVVERHPRYWVVEKGSDPEP